jgi:hypothetical protein
MLFSGGERMERIIKDDKRSPLPKRLKREKFIYSAGAKA